VAVRASAPLSVVTDPHARGAFHPHGASRRRRPSSSPDSSAAVAVAPGLGGVPVGRPRRGTRDPRSATATSPCGEEQRRGPRGRLGLGMRLGVTRGAAGPDAPGASARSAPMRSHQPPPRPSDEPAGDAGRAAAARPGTRTTATAIGTALDEVDRARPARFDDPRRPGPARSPGGEGPVTDLGGRVPHGLRRRVAEAALGRPGPAARGRGRRPTCRTCVASDRALRQIPRRPGRQTRSTMGLGTITVEGPGRLGPGRGDRGHRRGVRDRAGDPARIFDRRVSNRRTLGYRASRWPRSLPRRRRVADSLLSAAGTLR